MYQRAEITWYPNLDAGEVARAELVGNAIDELIQFFPGMDEGRRSSLGGGWLAAVDIRFIRQDGTALRLVVDPALEVWAEGSGQWCVNGDLEVFLRRATTRSGTDR